MTYTEIKKKGIQAEGSIFSLWLKVYYHFFLLGVDKIIVNEFETMKSESLTLRPCFYNLRKAVPG